MTEHVDIGMHASEEVIIKMRNECFVDYLSHEMNKRRIS